jgi:GDPmannose 4,6-dehydratase
MFRRNEVVRLCGDASRARTQLGWEPSVDFEQLVAMMVDAEVQRLSG